MTIISTEDENVSNIQKFRLFIVTNSFDLYSCTVFFKELLVTQLVVSATSQLLDWIVIVGFINKLNRTSSNSILKGAKQNCKTWKCNLTSRYLYKVMIDY